MARLAPRPWLVIHGEKTPTSARRSLEDCSRTATGPRSSGSSRTPSTTAAASSSRRPTPARLLDFVGRYAPRRPITESPDPEPRAGREVGGGCAERRRLAASTIEIECAADHWPMGSPPRSCSADGSGFQTGFCGRCTYDAPTSLHAPHRLAGRRSALARLARAFLGQTAARRRGPARAPARPDRPPRRQPVRPRPPFRRDPHPGRLPPPRPDPGLRRPRAVHRPRPPGGPRRPVRRRAPRS